MGRKGKPRQLKKDEAFQVIKKLEDEKKIKPQEIFENFKDTTKKKKKKKGGSKVSKVSKVSRLKEK
tara:strand:- start:241 stop:438 length:198 start_codon:yes stop_codon:yes gene_type:complete